MYQIGPKVTYSRERKSNSGSLKEAKINVKMQIVNEEYQRNAFLLGSWNKAIYTCKISYKAENVYWFTVSFRVEILLVSVHIFGM